MTLTEQIQPEIRRRLEIELDRRTVGQTYLFVGKSGTGKKTIAKWFLSKLICTAEKKPCGHCADCRSVKGGSGQNFIELGGEKLGISEVRAARRKLSLTSTGRVRAGLVSSAKFTPEAANAFLKLIEEPNPGAVIILLAEDRHQVLGTIWSRSRVIKFWPRRGAFLAEAGHGDELIAIMNQSLAERILWVKNQSDKDGMIWEERINAWLHLLRGALYAKSGRVLKENSSSQVLDLARSASMSRLLDLTEGIGRLARKRGRPVNWRLSLEEFMISL